MKKNILFLCTGNSCRSQMAEGWAKFYHIDKYNFYSAGIEKHGLNPYAVKTMKKFNVDISNHTSNTLEDFKGINFDLILTVCGHAHETCPIVPTQTQVQHIGFDDPPTLTKGFTKEEEILPVYEEVCTKIHNFVKEFRFD